MKLLESLYTNINFPTVSLKQVNCCDGMIISAASSEELQIFSSVEELQGSALISTFLDLMIKETVMLVMFESWQKTCVSLLWFQFNSSPTNLVLFCDQMRQQCKHCVETRSQFLWYKVLYKHTSSDRMQPLISMITMHCRHCHCAGLLNWNTEQ